MDTRKLEAFVKVVDLGSISRAAEAMHLAQSALSQQISSLETSLGVSLLARTKQGVVPTRAGRVFLRHAQTILRHMDQAVLEVRSQATGPSGRVSIGLAPYSLAASLTVPLIARVAELYPDIVLHVRENFGAILSEAIATGQMDLGVMFTPVSLRAVHVEPLFVDRLVLLVRHDLADRLPETIDYADLTSIPLLLPTRQHSIRQAIDGAFQRRNAFPSLAAEVERVPVLLQAIDAGLGATIIPAWAIPSLGPWPRLRMREVGAPPAELTVALCSAGFQPLSEQAAAVQPILRSMVLDAVRERSQRATATEEARS